MTDNVIKLVPAVEQAPSVDAILAAWAGRLSDVVLVGTSLSGDLIVAGSATTPETVMLLMQAQHIVVSGSLGDE